MSGSSINTAWVEIDGCPTMVGCNATEVAHQYVRFRQAMRSTAVSGGIVMNSDDSLSEIPGAVQGSTDAECECRQRSPPCCDRDGPPDSEFGLESGPAWALMPRLPGSWAITPMRTSEERAKQD
jgi:hypothetical protein